MNAFVKTLVGDAWNLAVVAGIVLAAGGLVLSGHTNIAVFAVPPLTLAGVAWLARR